MSRMDMRLLWKLEDHTKTPGTLACRLLDIELQNAANDVVKLLIKILQLVVSPCL